MEYILKENIERIDSIIEKMKEKKEVPLIDILREEIEKLKQLNKEYEASLHKKSIKKKEDAPNKTKYTLTDGSIYVVHKEKKYKYLYDASTSVITYEFNNGQIERTFPTGIKEIRKKDGTIVIKTSEKEYDIVNRE